MGFVCGVSCMTHAFPFRLDRGLSPACGFQEGSSFPLARSACRRRLGGLSKDVYFCGDQVGEWCQFV